MKVLFVYPNEYLNIGIPTGISTFIASMDGGEKNMKEQIYGVTRLSHRIITMDVITSKQCKFKKYYSTFHREQGESPLYSPLDIEYSRAYYQESTFKDLSFIVETNSTPVLAVIMALR